LLNLGALQGALGIALAAPNPQAGLFRVNAGWYIAGSDSSRDTLREAEAVASVAGRTVIAVSLNPVSGRVQTMWDDLDPLGLHALLNIIGVPSDEQLVLVFLGARSPFPGWLAHELSRIRGTRVYEPDQPPPAAPESSALAHWGMRAIDAGEQSPGPRGSRPGAGPTPGPSGL
jgi:hypothetical protein